MKSIHFDGLFSDALTKSIEEAYERAMSQYPVKKEETDAWLRNLIDPGSQTAFRYLYAYMPAADIVSAGVPQIASYVDAAETIYETIPYSRSVPAELFLAYVLFYRVGNEPVDCCRQLLYAELFPRIDGLSMKDAILAVNYWCYEKATYTPSDNRTLAPLAILKAARGRCGEESTLTVSALRAAGIPARQCYAPRWAHCDDNHAWVEAWTDGSWHYLGACEPEPVLDKGWFTAAASKSMLVGTKAFSGFLTGPGVRTESPLIQSVNCTSGYAPVREVCAFILDHGKPAAGVRVRFELCNYSELFPLYTAVTASDGSASFLTGYGDLHIQSEHEGRIVTGKLDVRKDDHIVLDFRDGFRPDSVVIPVVTEFDLVPPSEKISGCSRPSDEESKAHAERLKECERIRAAYEASFYNASLYNKEYTEEARWLTQARGNRREIEEFLRLDEFSAEEKASLLSTLREKDFIDIRCDILCEILREALPYRARYEKSGETDLFRLYVLAPRIADEPILPGRKMIRTLFQERYGDLYPDPDGSAISLFVAQHITVVPDYGCGNLPADNLGILTLGLCTKDCLPVFYVGLCRALGIAARLHPSLRRPEYLPVPETAHGRPVFAPAMFGQTGCKPSGVDPLIDGSASDDSRLTENRENASGAFKTLTLTNRSGRPLAYETHFTLGRYTDGSYETLCYEGMTLSDTCELELPDGSYRLITAARQIDGSVSARLTYFQTAHTSALPVILAADRMADKLKCVSIPDVFVINGGGESVSLYQACDNAFCFLLYAEPGKEPTEHLFQELLALSPQVKDAGIRIVILTRKDADRTNATLQRVLNALPAVCFFCEEEEYLHNLHTLMGVGDERLPFALVLSPGKKGLYAFTNYNIGTAETMLGIAALSTANRTGSSIRQKSV